MEDVKVSLARAILMCQQAVNGNSVEEPFDAYKVAVEQLQEILPSLPESIRPAVSKKIMMYEEHMGTLRVDTIINSKYKVFFKEDKSLATKFMALPPPPPDAPTYRTFWLINILLGTIKRGSFLTTNIWVPKDVWYQSNTNIPCQMEKIACFRYLTEVFKKFSTLKNDSSLSSELEGILQETSTIQNYLHFLDDEVPEAQLSFSHSKDKKLYVQKKNNILGSVQSYKEEAEDTYKGDTSLYSDTLNEFLKTSLSLEKLMQELEKDNEKQFLVTQKINTCINVLLVKSLADLVHLIKEFFQKSKESFLDVPSLLD